MTSQQQVFDPRKLEKLLIKDWMQFIDPRKLLNFIKNNIENNHDIIDPKIQSLMVSNCELKPEGISLWIDYNIVNSNNNVNVTNEVLLLPNGDINILNTI
jgi:hypothetical protein